MSEMTNFHDGALVCPFCGHDNLHQIVVATHSRREDDVAVVDAVDNRSGGKLFGWGLPNPSSRRQGVSIQFACEHCNEFPILTIYQHKGLTYIEWSDLDRDQRIENLARCLSLG